MFGGEHTPCELYVLCGLLVEIHAHKRFEILLRAGLPIQRQEEIVLTTVETRIIFKKRSYS
jgi:hypothetical protein